MIKPIPTRYAGRLFRSRTEARWAVAMDVAGIAYDYEAEGFALPSGCYLPDFWLPEERRWLEVKGIHPTREEEMRCQELAWATGFDAMLVFGTPGSSIDTRHPDYFPVWHKRGQPLGYQTDWELPQAAYDAALSARFGQ